MHVCKCLTDHSKFLFALKINTNGLFISTLFRIQRPVSRSIQAVASYKQTYKEDKKEE